MPCLYLGQPWRGLWLTAAQLALMAVGFVGALFATDQYQKWHPEDRSIMNIWPVLTMPAGALLASVGFALWCAWRFQAEAYIRM